jgi:hypothetical protein
MSRSNVGIEEKHILLPPMLYFQKPKLGPLGRRAGSSSSSKNAAADKNPLQVAFASGGFGLGLPSSTNRRDSEDDGLDVVDQVFVASEPENFDIDILERRNIIYGYLFLGVVNLVVTSILYHQAGTVDPSNVIPGSSSNGGVGGGSMVGVPYSGAPFVFQEVPLERRPVEVTSYTFMVICTLVGMVSAVMESPLGLSAYALSVVLNFLIGTSALPYFLFLLRYLVDLWMLYAALVLRSKLVMNYLGMHIHRV